MKKTILSVMLLLAVAVVSAQNDDNKRPKEMTPEMKTEMMVKTLSLDDAQKIAVLKLNTEYADLLKGPGRNGGRPPKRDASTDGTTGATQQERPQMTDEMKAKMQERMDKEKEYDGKLKSILSDEQYSSYQQSKAKRGGRGGKRNNDNNN